MRSDMQIIEDCASVLRELAALCAAIESDELVAACFRLGLMAELKAFSEAVMTLATRAHDLMDVAKQHGAH